MSNILTKTVKKVKILSILAAIVLAVAMVVGIVFGAMGMGVFNKDELLKDTKTVTVSVSQFVFESEEHLEVLENACDEALDGVNVVYELKGEMFGAACELVYVFASDVDLTTAKAALEAKAEALTAQGGALEGFDVTIGSNSEVAIGVLAQGYIWRGIVAGIVLVILVFAYVAIRHGLYMGIVSAASTALGTLLTTALFILTRIPVTASVTYVMAVSALLTAVTTVMSLNKIRANAEAAEGQTAEEVVGSSYATKEIVTFTALAGVALVIFGAVATEGVRWFAILALIALVVAAVVGLIYVPALYLPFKEKLDAKPVEGAYVGAEKTSTKVKKVFEKKQPVKEEVKAAPVVEEATEEEVVEEATEEEVVEETAEEVVEETTEEVPAEETPVEETEE